MSKKEMELVLVCKIGDFEGLKTADRVEKQEQLETFQEGKGRFRVRKSVDEEGTKYQVCVKSLQKTPALIKSVEECEEPVSEAFFEAYRKMADTLRIKDRYIFTGEKSIFTNKAGEEVPLPAITYEVDVFKRHDGTYSEWCKIDIELNQIKDALQSLDLEVADEEFPELFVKITHLPFKPQNAFMLGAATPEQQSAVSDLWDKEWTLTPFGESMKPVEASVSQIPETPDQPTTTENPKAENEQSNNVDESV